MSTSQIASAPSPQSTFHALIVVVQGYLVRNGFQCVVEQPSTVPGFSPSLRELPPSQFLPPGWDSDPSNAMLLYKFKNKNGKVYCLAMVSFDDLVMVTISQRGGGEASLEIPLSTHIQVDSDPTSTTIQRLGNYRILNYEELIHQLQTIITRIIPDFSTGATSTSGNSSSTRGGAGMAYYPTAPSLPTPPAGISSGSSNYIIPYNIGRSDLDPFSNHTMQPVPVPFPSSGGGGGAGPSFMDTGGGSLVGPNHPLFHQPPSSGSNNVPYASPFLPGFAPPQPRGDLNQPIFNANLAHELGFHADDYDEFGQGGGPGGIGGPGGRGPGRGGGRGGRGGRGGGNNLFPGEPNPDHLKPPGW